MANNMSILNCVPLDVNLDKAVDLIPTPYLEAFLFSAHLELQIALESSRPNSNWGLCLLDYNPNNAQVDIIIKWFGSEVWLARLYQGIASRVTERVANKYTLTALEAETLMVLKDSDRCPSWVKHQVAWGRQVYSVFTWDCWQRLNARYQRIKNELPDTEYSNGVFIDFRDWVYCYQSAKTINGFLSEASMVRLNNTLYQQSLRAFYNRSELDGLLCTTGIHQILDDQNHTFCQARAVPSNQYRSLQNDRCRRLNISRVEPEPEPEPEPEHGIRNGTPVEVEVAVSIDNYPSNFVRTNLSLLTVSNSMNNSPMGGW